MLYSILPYRHVVPPPRSPAPLLLLLQQHYIGRCLWRTARRCDWQDEQRARIIEGGATVFASFFLFFLLPDFPEEVKWLTAEEKTFVARRLQVDQGKSAVERVITLRDVGRVFRDYKVIAAGFCYFGLIVPAYSYAYFAPGIIKGYGYGSIMTQLYSVPPWAAAFGFSMMVAWASDKTRHRFGFVIFTTCVGIVGFAMLISIHDKTHVQYAALFLVTMGTYTAMPLVVCWFNMNLGGHHRRAVGSAWQVGFGNIGGIIATFSFLTKDAPKYISGYSICIAFTILSLLASVTYGIACWAENKKRNREVGNEQGLSEDEKTILGDRSPDYRYLL
jgi:hypothetical protein